MLKLSSVLLLGAMSCLLEEAYSNNYFYYPNSQPAPKYQYQPYSPYVYPAYSAPADCDKTVIEVEEEGKTSESSSSESSSSESSSSESTEGGTEGLITGVVESISEENKEGGETEPSSVVEEEGKKEEVVEEVKKEEPEKKEFIKYIFPPVTSFPYTPQSGRQVVYSAPASYPSYMPYKTYSVVSQPATYSMRSNGYNTYPSYYSLSSVPVSGEPARIMSSPNVGRLVSAPSYTSNTYSAVPKTLTFSPSSSVGGSAGYYNGNVGYYRV